MTSARADTPRDGLDDPGFGVGGQVTLSVFPGPTQPHGVPVVWDVAADAAGRIYLLTSASSPAGTFPAVVRLDRSGRVDASYGDAGRAVVPTTGAFEASNLVGALSVDAAGNAFVGAIRRRADTSYCTALHRLRADGSHDDGFPPFPPERCTDFGSPFVGNLAFWFVRLNLHQGRLLLSGPTAAGGNAVGAGLARLELDGTPVPGFGAGGLLRPASFSGGLSLDADRTVGFGPPGCLSALDPNGLPESGFGNAGCAPLIFLDARSLVLDLVRDESNRIVTLGAGLPNSVQLISCQAGILRHHASGARDLSFNAAGLSFGPPGSVCFWSYLGAAFPESRVSTRAMIARPGSRLAAFADVRVSPTGRSGQILALTPDGAPDLRFGPASTPGRVDLMVDGDLSQLGILAAVTPAGMAVVLLPIPSTSTTVDRTIVRHLIDDQLTADGFE
jgi:hypothetical protein